MTTDCCRVCGGAFLGEPLLCLENMPKSAQHLPRREELSADKSLTLSLFQCSGCGLLQLNTPPVSYYREVIRAAAFSEEMRDFRLKQFEYLVVTYGLEGSKVLEVGCGRGEYLALLQQAGVEAYGVEASVEAAETCRYSGLNVVPGFIEGEGSQLADAPFRGFFMLNYLEHLPDPVAVLRGVAQCLEEGGVGLVEVPNFEMVLQCSLFTEVTSDHLLYFTKRTLCTLLELSGFELISCETVWYDYILSAIVRKRSQCVASGFADAKSRLAVDIEEFLAAAGQCGVAIWGAGHQALTIMAMLGLGGKVRYVVDSAPFKQGRFTPATHVPIVSPEQLVDDPVDAVIVMAASYSDEVARILLKKYADLEHVAIVRGDRLEYLRRSELSPDG